MKVVAYYLPQFHETKENNEWWGNGFTEWTNVKKARALFDGHEQPRKPLNRNYYNLLNDDVKEKQINLTKKFGVDAFCFYHYWFNGHLLLEKPVEQFLKNKNLNIEFCLSWANEPWTKAWVSKNDSILIDQDYHDKNDWKAHFDYLLPFFKDSRYIKEDGKPLFVIYRPEQIPNLNQILDYWSQLAKNAGFNGISYCYQQIDFMLDETADKSRFNHNIEYEPAYALHYMENNLFSMVKKVLKKIDDFSQKLSNHKLSEYYLKSVRKISYDKVWESCLNEMPLNSGTIPGAFVDFDNTPRRGTKGLVFTGRSANKFEDYMTQKIKLAKSVYNSEYLFLFAWNEWAEGGYLEPDEKNGYAYLNALKNALKNNEVV